jgi:hypothetical protein
MQAMKTGEQSNRLRMRILCRNESYRKSGHTPIHLSLWETSETGNRVVGVALASVSFRLVTLAYGLVSHAETIEVFRRIEPGPGADYVAPQREILTKFGKT